MREQCFMCQKHHTTPGTALKQVSVSHCASNESKNQSRES